MSKKKNLIIGVILVIIACMVCATWYSYTNVGSASFDSTNGRSKIIVNKSRKKTTYIKSILKK